jgi:hypothetical protein
MDEEQERDDYDRDVNCDHSCREEEFYGQEYLGTRCTWCGAFFPKLEEEEDEPAELDR